MAPVEEPVVLEPPTPAPPRLVAPPAAFATTRDVLHRLAEEVVAPRRVAIDGDFRLRWLPGGFGTPRLPGDRQLRVEGAALVTVADGAATREPLDADDAAARWLGDLYAFALAALEALRTTIGGDEPTLWPEHFDYAIVAGDEARGTRANYGVSPGDEHHAEPYLYVGPFEPREGPLWNAVGFSGAELGLAELLAAPDQAAAAHAFFTGRAAALERHPAG